MERVQYQQEQMLAELKDLVDKNLFTEKEVKQILKKRTTFETALVRRVAKKADFLRYIAYEMGLEQLRRKRIERLNIPRTPSSLSDFALVKRQYQIFERALKRFKSDVDLWTRYIQVAKRQGARSLVGRITARALQIHPHEPKLYIIAASHEVENLSPSTARTLLQRGLRMNADKIELWKEYVKMELGFIEGLRRRWDVLGIKTTEQKGKNKENDYDTGGCNLGPTDTTNEGLPDSMGVDAAIEGDAGAVARGEIMQGAIVKSVITNACQAIPKIELFEALKTIIEGYPSPPDLREALVAHLYDVLGQKLPNDAKAIKLCANRFLMGGKQGTELIEGLKQTNEELMKAAERLGQEDVFEVYSEFVEDWCSTGIDTNQKLYLISSLRSLIQRAPASQSLLSTHIRLLVRFGEDAKKVPAKITRTCRKYTKKVPRSSRVWLARLEAERKYGSDDNEKTNLMKAWRKAREKVKGTEEEVIQVWRWGLEEGETQEERVKIHEMLMRESLRESSQQGVHEMLLSSYVRLLHEARTKPVSSVTSDQEDNADMKWQKAIHHMDV
ncbi:hypothetical protein AMATHDRAFT_57722 [Amanita thiersii Skay4041]|uniref:U3 small nucleolar RNA-associated protein 6 N-terminal domain-containing protein n=1 Tax=Amanita thiersii Skay4041 TaxID=703135 RepID=A0A2A9NNB2_9AGAR|nr:hypothetical protein AMATHDRAFT_57722 [Amanita thiersii Skay4041]